jgi:hypothetical protein
MYALGVTLFELTFGRRPFALRGDSLRKRLQSHQQAPIEFPDKWPPEIPEQFRDVLARLLAKEPTERYEDYAGLREELRAVTPVGSTPAARLPRALAWLTDLAILSILQAPLVLPATILGFAGGEAAAAFADLGVGIPFGLVEFAFGLLGLFGWVAIPLLALWWDLRRWRTPGRYLLPRRVVMLRSVLRYMEFWVAALFCLPLVLALPAATIIEETLGRAWMLIDALFIFGPTRRTLHDRICRTHVVLDERSVPKLRVDQLGS